LSLASGKSDNFFINSPKFSTKALALGFDQQIKTFRLPVKSLNSRMHERLNELALEQKKRNQQRGYRQ
jgi:hypothetical protein